VLSKTIRCLLILACAIFLPLYAQSSKPAKPGTANETMGTNPSTTTITTKTTTIVTDVKTTSTKKTATHHNLRAGHTSKASVYIGATRLGSLLEDAQGKAMLTPAAWKSIAVEAEGLINKIVREAGGDRTAHKAATDARTHIREMRVAATAGNADGAKSHAGMALPYVYKLIEWSAPAK